MRHFNTALQYYAFQQKPLKLTFHPSPRQDNSCYNRNKIFQAITLNNFDVDALREVIFYITNSKTRRFFPIKKRETWKNFVFFPQIVPNHNFTFGMKPKYLLVKRFLLIFI